MTSAVYIGRFRPFHYGHLSVIANTFRELDIDHLTIMVGSSNKHQSVKNPFNFEQTKAMIGNGIIVADRNVPEKERMFNRISIVSLDDHPTDSGWQTQVRQQAKDDTKYIVGYDKDESSYYLNIFPEWTAWQAPVFSLRRDIHNNVVPLNATDLRKVLLSSKHDDNMLSRNFSLTLPHGTIEYLKHWITLPDYDLMREEYDYAQAEIEKFKWYPYPDSLNVACADNVVVCNGMILLVERKYTPGKGCFALPGGHKDNNETFLNTAIRELKEETKLKIPEKVLRGSIKGEKMFDSPSRSFPLTRLTMAYHFEVEPNHDGSLPLVKAADDAKSAKWYPLSFVKENAHKMFDDHAFIVNHFTGV